MWYRDTKQAGGVHKHDSWLDRTPAQAVLSGIKSNTHIHSWEKVKDNELHYSSIASAKSVADV